MQTYPTGYTESHRMAEKIFREILPRHGMAVREEQIALCHEVSKSVRYGTSSVFSSLSISIPP